MYSTHNEGKSVVAERFTRTLKNKTYKYVTSISKNVYIDKFDEYNNTYPKLIPEIEGSIRKTKKWHFLTIKLFENALIFKAHSYRDHNVFFYV